ncbi:MAG TPA: aspartate aminotransferase family protein [Xanthobacteraceae bacterium]|nr:aspartate aminotransferase family protein [Xanthobacteraceae bacterium]
MSYILHRSLGVELPVAVKGDGCTIVDADGKRYLDACGGAAVSCLGHSRPDIYKAIADQMNALAYVHSGAFSNAAAEELAEFLITRSPQGFGTGRALYLGSGSEAMEAALKLARQYHLENGQPERHRIIARNMAYHGNTLAALAVGGHAQRRKPYQPLLMEVGRIPACYAYRLQEPGESDEAFGRRMADALEAEIQRLGPETVAAFVFEPVSGATLGTVPPAPGYVRRLREICDRHGVLMIADEVMCGMGRTGTLFALEPEGVHADIVTIAKGLAAGFAPLAAVLASEKVVTALAEGSGTLWNGHTYMSHSAACAGALAVLKAIEAEDLLANVRRQGAHLRQRLIEAFGPNPHIGDIRGRGLFQTIELVADRETKVPFPAGKGLAAKIKTRAQNAGLLVYPAAGCVDGVNGDHVLLAPPYIVTAAQIDEIVAILRQVVEACLAEALKD